MFCFLFDLEFVSNSFAKQTLFLFTTNNMLYNLKKIASDYVNFTTDELFLIASLFKSLPTNKEKYIIEKGQFISDIYFLNSGILRSYIQNDTKEENVKFYFGPLFFSDLESIVSKSKTLRNFITVNESDIYVAKFEEIKILNFTSKKHQYFFNKIFKNQYLFHYENKIE